MSHLDQRVLTVSVQKWHLEDLGENISPSCVKRGILLAQAADFFWDEAPGSHLRRIGENVYDVRGKVEVKDEGSWSIAIGGFELIHEVRPGRLPKDRFAGGLVRLDFRITDRGRPWRFLTVETGTVFDGTSDQYPELLSYLCQITQLPTEPASSDRDASEGQEST